MQKKLTSTFLMFVSSLMVIIMAIPICVSGVTLSSIQPRASEYLDNYGAYIYLAGNGTVQVWFDVQGTGTMDELGALSISIYESKDGNEWTWKKTFTHDSTDGMLGYDDFYHSGHVDYEGVEGRYYKAYICVWGGKGGKGDTRYFWTIPQPDLP